MKKILLCALLGWATLNACAQTPQKLSRWSVALTAGPAFAVGTFASLHNYYSTAATSVKAGGSAELAGEYRICRSFSAALAVSGQQNHGNGTYDNLAGTLYYGDEYPGHHSLNTNWQIARVLAGGIYTLPQSKPVGPTLMVRLLAGLQRTRTPDFSYLSLYNGNTLVTIPGASLPWTFSYEADAGVKWSFRSRVALLAYAGYNGCRPSKTFMPLVYFGPLLDGPTSPGKISTNATLPTGTLFFRSGVEVRL